VKLGLTYVFIAHDLSVVRHVCDRIAVMYLGRIVEVAETEELFRRPRHPYTRHCYPRFRRRTPDLVNGDDRIVLRGDPPSPVNPPSGCRFHPRCPRAQAVASSKIPL